MKRIFVGAVFTIGLTFLHSAVASSQEPDRAVEGRARDQTTQNAAPDYMFPRPSVFEAAFASGMPYLGIGELAYGVSEGLTASAVAGATPNLVGRRGTMAFGIRPRGVLLANNDWRTYWTASVLYYPKVDGFGGDREPWMLARPTLSIERRFRGDIRASVVVGVVAAACTESLVTLGRDRTMMGGVWDTAGIAGAIPLSARASVFAETALVMDGVVPARDWIGGSPVIAMVGVATAL
jgi:hypothetical protein